VIGGPRKASFQFYPADWRGNAKLRRCSEAARGAWIDVMCLMHDSDEYGVLRWPLAEIARAVGVPIRLLRELTDREVMKGGDLGAEPYVYVPRSGRKNGDPVMLIESCTGPCWYSSRMVKDEYVRQHAGASTRFGSPCRPDGDRQGDVKGDRLGDGQGDGSSSSSSSAVEKPFRRKSAVVRAGDPYPADFEEIWAAYPRREGGNSKRDAFKAFRARLREGVAAADLLDGVRRYAAFVRAKGIEGSSFVMQAATFLGPGERFREAWIFAGGDPGSRPAILRGAVL